jgi:hypothetical protein
LWLRRGAGLLIFATIGGFLAALSASSHPWLLDAGWGIRNSAGLVLIFCPLLAAVVAYDVSRRVNPTLAEVGRGSSRGMFAAFLPMTAAFLWALAATAVSWAVIGMAASSAGGVGASDPWIYLETISAYAAAAAVGTLVGNHVKGVTSVAVAAGIVLAAAVVLAGPGIKAFQVASSWGTMIGLERTPLRAALAIAVNLSIALLCMGVAGLTSGVRRPSRLALGALAIPLVASLIIAVTLPIRDSEYRATREAQACVGSSPVVCGPARATDLLSWAQHDLAAARLKLRDSQLALPARFVIARGDAARALGSSATPLEYDPSSLVDGHLGRDVLVQDLATPRLCEALYGEGPQEYLDLIFGVSQWLTKALEPGQGPSEAAPPAVRAAYAKLLTCPIAAAPVQ